MITTRTNGPVTTLILDRPAKRNALTYGMITNLHSGIAAVEADENCRALVITGADGHFAAGREQEVEHQEAYYAGCDFFRY